MARRHTMPESVHAARWMVSYADFMTLLFAFFVVLYASSTVNNKKFDEMSQSLVGVFEGKNKSLLPFQIDAIFPSLAPASDVTLVSSKEADRPEPPGDLLEIFQGAMEPLLQDSRFSLQISESWLQLEVPADRIFKQTGTNLSLDGEQILSQLSKTFSRFPHPINIEIFNDSQTPNANSPWLLSAMQGASIVQFLSLEDIQTSRMAVVAYGPYQPISTNADDDGQALNRRVIFLIDRTRRQRDRLNIVTKRHLSAKP